MKKLSFCIIITAFLITGCSPVEKIPTAEIPDFEIVPSEPTAQIEKTSPSKIMLKQDDNTGEIMTALKKEPEDNPEPTSSPTPVVKPEPIITATWLKTTLTDIKTDKTFRISDFAGKPILLESFAVWCPTCTKQQNEIKKLHDIVGDSVISISLDTDPNEDSSKVLNHVNQHGFDWKYAISPNSLTQSLVNEFGISVVNAPGAPVILICSDQSFRFLDRGVKKVKELQQEINKGCK